MNKDYENLIDSLTNDLKQSKNSRVLSTFKVSGIWLSFAFFGIGLLMFFIRPFRPDVIHQFISEPLFLAELILGFMAVCFICLGVFQSAVPGEKTTLLKIGIAFYVMWILIISYGFLNPIIKPSMIGKRDECYFEAIYYSIALITFTVVLLKRRYSLQPKLTAIISTILVASIPAYLMQIACMYEVNHAFTNHLIPAWLTAVVLAPIIHIALIKKRLHLI